MPSYDVTTFLGLVALMLASAKVFGLLAKRFRQPPLLGEMVAGILLGNSLLGFIDPEDVALKALADFGFVIFLFQVGLELNVSRFLSVLRPATLVAIASVALPYIFGYLVCRGVGLENHVAIGVGAAITASSLGVVARTLSDLKRLEDPESQVILGAAVLGNIFGLILLGAVADMARGLDVTLGGVAWQSAKAYGFLLAVLAVGHVVVPWLFRHVSRVELPGTATALAVTLALALAWLADRAGAARAVGSFFGGLLAARTPQAERVTREVMHLEQVLVSLAFVFLGAQIDLRTLDPMETAYRQTLLLGLLLTAAAVAGKFLAGQAAIGFPGSKKAVGVGMITHGEIGFVFAHIGLSSGVFDRSVFSAIAFMVIVTSFAGIALLQYLMPPKPDVVDQDKVQHSPD